jgi:metal-sulfur cluster biosynthetic enzyme|nr:MAG TPA: hypothetical protein [Caudoviricetes sp.]
MTKERVMELTDTVIDVAMNRDGFTDRERINDLYKIGFEYVDEICKVMPPVTDATLPFVIAALGVVRNSYMNMGNRIIEAAAKDVQRTMESKITEVKKDFK